MKATDNNLFMLIGATLFKYDTALKQQGMLNLIEPPTETDVSERSPMPPMPMPMPMPGVMLVAGTAGSQSLVILLGDQFFRVDAESLSIKAQAMLPAPEPPKDMPNPRHVEGFDRPCPPMVMHMAPPAGLELHGDKLYVLRANMLCAINIKDGSIVGQTKLPEPEKPEK
jgi:hypothetical protein